MEYGFLAHIGIRGCRLMSPNWIICTPRDYVTRSILMVEIQICSWQLSSTEPLFALLTSSPSPMSPHLTPRPGSFLTSLPQRPWIRDAGPQLQNTAGYSSCLVIGQISCCDLYSWWTEVMARHKAICPATATCMAHVRTLEFSSCRRCRSRLCSL